MEATSLNFLPEALREYPPLLLLALAVGVLVVVILILVGIVRALRGSGNRHPGLTIHSFQIAPLGRDAFLKITNPGPPVTLIGLIVTERADVSIKNQVAGQSLPTNDTYSILLEATADERLRSDFELHFQFFDREKRNYLQHFSLNPVGSVKLKVK